MASLWIGGELGRIERLALASFVANGHHTVLYSYGDVRGVPQGVEQRDAATVLPQRLTEHHRLNGSYALFSDRFRFELQKLGLGMWIDADVVCLKPVLLTGAFVAGRESDRYINGAVLLLAPDSPLLADAIASFDAGRLPPWTPFHRAPLEFCAQALGFKVPPNRQPRGTYGPKAITALAARHGLTDAAQPETVFYPVHPRVAESVFEPGRPLDSVVSEQTLTLHLWNEKLGALKRTDPPRDSILGQLYRRYQV